MKFPYNEALSIRWQYKQGKITREEALQKLGFILDLDDQTDMCREALLYPDDKYTASYGPLVRLSDVCNTLRKWATLVSKQGDFNEAKTRQFYDHWTRIDLAISKSNFLARLFFTEDGVRKTPCPTHKGKWSGCVWVETGAGPCACTVGGNVTGWLPEDPRFSDRTEWLTRVEKEFPHKAPCGHRVKSVSKTVSHEHGTTCDWCYDNWREFEGFPREFTEARQEPPIYDESLIVKPHTKPTGFDAIP